MLYFADAATVTVVVVAAASANAAILLLLLPPLLLLLLLLMLLMIFISFKYIKNELKTGIYRCCVYCVVKCLQKRSLSLFMPSSSFL